MPTRGPYSIRDNFRDVVHIIASPQGFYTQNSCEACVATLTRSERPSVTYWVVHLINTTHLFPAINSARLAGESRSPPLFERR